MNQQYWEGHLIFPLVNGRYKFLTLGPGFIVRGFRTKEEIQELAGRKVYLTVPEERQFRQLAEEYRRKGTEREALGRAAEELLVSRTKM